MNIKAVCVLLICIVVTEANSIADKEVSPTTTEASTSIDNVTEPVVEDRNTTIDFSETREQDLKNELFRHVMRREYDEAFQKASYMYNIGFTHVVEDVANLLINGEHPQFFDFAYKIIQAKEGSIAKACFPSNIQVHEPPMPVQIVNHQYGCALEYGDSMDWAGDMILYCHPNITQSRDSILWKLEPEWRDDRLYFMLRTVGEGYYMKLGNSRDGDGDHLAYGSRNYDTDRHLWYLKPVRNEGNINVYIVNKEYDEILKAGVERKRYGRHRVYGQSKKQLRPIKTFSWDIHHVNRS